MASEFAESLPVDRPVAGKADQAMPILVAEDELVTARLLRGLLDSWGFDVIAVADGVEALQVLQAVDAPRLAILDWMMPGLDGPEVCRLARLGRPSLPMYLILLTSREARVDIVAGLDAGADDYVIKPPDPAELRARLKVGLRVLAMEHHFERVAMIDSLTGLRNRRWLDVTFARQIARSLHAQQAVSLLMIDVDRFKQLNDEHGHLAGDDVLRALAQTLNAHVRPQDLLARYGGEEFLLLLPNTGIGDGLIVAERLRNAVDHAGADLAPLPPATVSIGIAVLFGEMSLTQLVALADAALYRAKQAGRNRVSQ